MKVGQLFNRLRGSRFVRVPELNDMSIDELRAWYDARERNHFLINVLFHAVVGVFTAGLFHFIWFAIARPAMQTPTWRRQHPPKVHPNILMLIKPFNAVRELITTVKEQIDNYQTPRERRVGSFDAGNQEEEIIEIPRWDEAVVSPAMPHKDVRSLWWSRLDDETLITTFIRPVDKKSRQLALHELFSRRSNSAVAYRNNYFRYYISHNLMKQQALSASYLKSLSTNFPDDERLFVFTITALAQLDQEHPAYANHIINSFYGHHSGDYSKPSINCDNFLCSVALNEFSIAHYNAKDPKHDAAIRAVAGDMSKIHESLHEKVFGGFFRGQGNTWVKNYHQFKVEEWDPVYQEKLLNRILEFLSTSAYSYRDTYENLEHINFDLFDKNILTDFVHQLTSNMSLQNLTKSFKNSRETEKITALGVVLHSCTDPDILETIFTPLLKELHKPQDNWKKLRYLHALSKTNFANLPEDLKPRFIDFLCDEVNIQLENHNPKEMISLTIANLDFALINKKDQQRLIKAVQNSSRPLALLWATHFDHIDRGLYQQYIFDVMDFNSDNFAQTIRSKGNSCLKHIKPEAQNQLAEVALDDDKCGDFDIDINKATFFTQLDIRCLSKEIRQSICKIFVLVTCKLVTV